MERLKNINQPSNILDDVSHMIYRLELKMENLEKTQNNKSLVFSPYSAGIPAGPPLVSYKVFCLVPGGDDGVGGINPSLAFGIDVGWVN